MRDPDDSPELDTLTTDECRVLLRTCTVGRFAVALPDEPPLVVPVNYVVDADVIVFRTDPGDKVHRLRQQPASFQIDAIDHVHRSGWSVLIRGVAYEALPAEVDHLELRPWVGDRATWVRLVPTSITGRRIRLPDRPLDARGYK